jgi:hypothetical protein
MDVSGAPEATKTLHSPHAARTSQTCQVVVGGAFLRERVTRQPSRDHRRVAMITAPNGGTVPMIADGRPDIPDTLPRDLLIIG